MKKGKSKMELIRNEKVRRMTYKKRMQGFKKKISEISTLCDVKAYSIIFRPKTGRDSDGLVEPETWPENKDDVYDFLKQFQNYEQGKKEEGIAEFLKNRTKKVTAELKRLREQNDKKWLDQCSLDQLRTLSTELDLKVEHVKQKLDQTQGDQDLVEKAMKSSSSPVTDNVQVQVLQQPQPQPQPQPPSYVMDQCLPLNFTYGVDYGDNFCLGSTSTLPHTYTPPLIPVAQFHQDSSLPPILDEYGVMFNNSSQAVGGYYFPEDPESFAMAQFHQNSALLPTLDEHGIMFNNSSQAVGGSYIPEDPESYAMAQFHQNSSLLSILDEYAIMSNNSSQAVGGYYIPEDPESYATGLSTQLHYRYHHHQQQQ